MAQWWYYSGSVTTSVKGVEIVLDSKRCRLVHVNDDADNARVIKPRTRFAAPMGSVQHLVRIKKVKAIQPPREARLAAAKAAKEALEVASPALVVTKSTPATQPIASSRDADGAESVVASPATDQEPSVSAEAQADSMMEKSSDAGEGEPSEPSAPSEEEVKPTRRRKRRG